MKYVILSIILINFPQHCYSLSSLKFVYLFMIQKLSWHQSFVQKEIGVKYIDYDYSPTQLFQYFQAFGFNIFTYYIIILFCIFNVQIILIFNYKFVFQ